MLNEYDALLVDLDGTVHRGNTVIPGVITALQEARLEGRALRFVTNNAWKTPQDLAARLVDLGITAEANEVSTSAQAAALVLRERLHPQAEVLVVGTAGLESELVAVGLRPVREAGPSVAAVVQGHSPHTGWKDLAQAYLALQAGALWVACNTDSTLPTEQGLLPGNGAMVAALRCAMNAGRSDTAVHREPIVAGKPQPALLQTAAQSAQASNALVIGDRLDTDIAGAVAAGMDSLLVLSGVASAHDVLTASIDQRPNYLAADLTAIQQPAGELAIRPQPGWRLWLTDSAIAIASAGSTDEWALLRTICAVSWNSEVAQLHAQDDQAATALAKLGLS